MRGLFYGNTKETAPLPNHPPPSPPAQPAQSVLKETWPLSGVQLGLHGNRRKGLSKRVKAAERWSLAASGWSFIVDSFVPPPSPRPDTPHPLKINNNTTKTCFDVAGEGPEGAGGGGGETDLWPWRGRETFICAVGPTVDI